MVFAWWSATATGVLDPKFLTPPQTVLSKLADGLAAGGDLRQQVWPSLRRGLSGFLIGTGLGVVLGILVGSVRVLEKAFDPVLLFFRSLSILALFPVFLLFFGIGEQSKVAIVTWAAFWPVFISTVNAVKGVEKILLNAARTARGRTRIHLHPGGTAGLRPEHLPGVRLAASYAFTRLGGSRIPRCHRRNRHLHPLQPGGVIKSRPCIRESWCSASSVSLSTSYSLGSKSA